jgi:hypothetical protein
MKNVEISFKVTPVIHWLNPPKDNTEKMIREAQEKNLHEIAFHAGDLIDKIIKDLLFNSPIDKS